MTRSEFWSTVLALVLCSTLTVGAQETEPRRIGDFTIEVEWPRQDVISQDNTGTCWSFATVSFLESEVARITKKPVDLSEIYPVYWAYMEKARRFVRYETQARLSEGGLSHDVIAMAKRYGVVPQEAYPGLPEGQNNHDHASELFPLLEVVLKKVAESKTPMKHWETAVRALLDVFMTRPPETVSIDGKEMTPVDYATNVLKIPFDDYVEVTSFEYLPFGAEGELMVPDNWMRFDGYKNLKLDDMMSAMDAALRRGFTVAVDMDVSERGFRAQQGVAKLEDALEKDGAITQDLRERMFESKQTTDDHLMHVVGIAKDSAGKTFYITKNSWGQSKPYDGYLFMSRNYVALKMLAFMVHHDGLVDHKQ